MLKSFQQQLKILDVAKSCKVLVAVSGGLDSMVLLHLIRESGYDFGVAHVNFGLRGKDSEKDEKMVHEYCKKRHIPFHVSQPETAILAKKNSNSIQIEARNLRYAFFNEICSEFSYSNIATAHHKNDSLENLFIYLLRSNIAAAFSGIAPQNGNIIRPLLAFSRNDILEFANQNKIKWREDSSYAKTDYLRNKIRHFIMPGLEHEFPTVLTEYAELSGLFRKVQQQKHLVFLKALHHHSKVEKNGDVLLSSKIKNDGALAEFMHWYLRPFGFSKAAIQKAC